MQFTYPYLSLPIQLFPDLSACARIAIVCTFAIPDFKQGNTMPNSTTADNFKIEAEAESILDLSETSPFGDFG
jgi:hypothetical protein